MEDIRHIRAGVVTQLCLDYGLIDKAVYFTSGEVLGGMPLKEGDLVNCIAVRHGAQGGWKALRVRNLCVLQCKPANTEQVTFPPFSSVELVGYGKIKHTVCAPSFYHMLD